MLAKVFSNAFENRSEAALEFGLKMAKDEDEICTLMTPDPKMADMLLKRL